MNKLIFSSQFKPRSWATLYSRSIKAVRGYDLLNSDDRILIAVSGGGDSLAMLDMFAWINNKIGRKMGLSFIVGHVPGRYLGKDIYPVSQLEQYAGQYGFKFAVSPVVLKEVVFKDCFICAMARRKLLFDLAEREGCNKIALGHNADDMVETALLNMFYQGRFSSMSAKQTVLRKKLTLIRPLSLVWKKDITLYAKDRFGKLPKFKCPGSNNSKRAFIKTLLKKLEKQNPKIKANILTAITNPKLEYLPVFKKPRL